MRRPDLRVLGRGEAARAVGVFLLAPLCFGLVIGALAALVGSDEVDWAVAALAFTGFATLLLAGSTYALVAHERGEEERRPRLSLHTDDEKIQTHAEGDDVYVRLFVRNAEGRRASKGTRVLVERYYAPGAERPTTFGSPALGWTSAAAGSRDEAVVIFSGAERVIDLGVLRRDLRDGLWREFEISLPLLRREGVEIVDRRQYVSTGTVIRLVVGSDEADARFYNVHVGWNEHAGDPDGAKTSLVTRVLDVPSLSTGVEISWAEVVRGDATRSPA